MSARFYIQPPTSGAALRKIDQPAGVVLEILDPDERERQVVTARSASGIYTASWWADTTMELRMRWSRETAALRDWHHQVVSLVEWLDRGASIGIARDSTKAGLWPLTNSAGTTLRGGISDGATAVYLGDDYLGWETSPALADEDDVVIESESPESQRWATRVDAYSAGPPVQLTAALAMWGDIGGEGWCRHRDFYPYLYRREEDRGVPAITQEEVGFAFAMTLRLRLILPTVELP